EVRPDARPGAGAGLARRARIPPRPLRRRHHGAPAEPPRHLADGAGGGAAAAARGGALARRSGAGGAAPGVERHPLAISAGALYSRAVQRGGGAAAGGGGAGRGQRRAAAHLCRARAALQPRGPLPAAPRSGGGGGGGGVRSGRSVGRVVAVLGILKSGGAYVPLDPDHPPQRLAYLLGETACPLLLAEPHLLAALPETALSAPR